MTSIKQGKFQKAEERTEQTAYGPSAYRHTEIFIIEERSFNGKPPKLYQTEQTYRNSVMTHTGNYPADTEYAKNRRSWVCNF